MRHKKLLQSIARILYYIGLIPVLSLREDTNSFFLNRHSLIGFSIDSIYKQKTTTNLTFETQ